MAATPDASSTDGPIPTKDPVSFKDSVNFAARLAIPAVTGLGNRWLIEKQRELVAEVGEDQSLTPEQRAYRGLLSNRFSRLDIPVADPDEEDIPGKGGSFGIAVVNQADYYPTSAAISARCCGRGGDEDEDNEDAEMQAIFMKAQPDRNLEGEVTQAQISVCLPLEMQEKLTDEAFAAMDKDNSGTFDYGEIKDILARCSNAKEDKKMRLLFDRIDKDKSGSITATELQGVLPYVTESQMERLVEEFDENHDGLFTFEEMRLMGKRLTELGADSLPIPYCQALMFPIESLKGTSMEMAQYFLGLRFMCIMYCVMCFFGGVLVACNWVINDQLLKYKIHVQVGAPGTDYEGAYAPADLIRTLANLTVFLEDTPDAPYQAFIGETPGTLDGEAPSMTDFAKTSSFPSLFLASYSYQSFFERKVWFPTMPDSAWNLLATAEIIHTVVTVMILCFLIWALGALNDQIRGSEELLDKGVTSCSDFTMEVTCIPPSATAVQIAGLFRRWGPVSKVALHFPTKSVLVQKSFEMSRKVTKLRFVARKERVHREAQQDHLDKGRTKNRRSSLAEAMADRTLKVVDVATTENEIKDLLDECSKEIEEGTPKCGTNPPTPFATAFVSFVHEDDREECEQSFHNSGKLDFVSFMGCGKPIETDEEEIDASKNPFILDQRWMNFLGQLPLHFKDEWEGFAKERAKGCCRKLPEHGNTMFLPADFQAGGEVEALEEAAWIPDGGHTRMSTIKFICDLKLRSFLGCTLHAVRAPEPGDVRWENLHVATCSKFLRYAILITTLVVFCLAVSVLSAMYILVSGFGDKVKENPDVAALFAWLPDNVAAFLFSIAPLVISQINLVTKLIATKALVPALATYIRHRSESAYTAAVLVCTFAVETMQTAFLITASFVLATMSSRPYSDGDLPGESGAPVRLIDVQTGNNVMQALGYYLFIVCVNGAISLMLMDSPGMVPVWIGRLVGVGIPKLLACCKCPDSLVSKLKMRVPEQHALDSAWRAPASPIHIWTSKLAGSLVAVCAVGPWYPLVYFGAAFQVTTMLLCELWSLLKLHSKPDPRGFEVAHISATIYQACVVVCIVSTLYFNWLMFGATKGGSAVKFWVPILLCLAIWMMAVVLTPLVMRVIPALVRKLLERDPVEDSSARGEVEAEGEEGGAVEMTAVGVGAASKTVDGDDGSGANAAQLLEDLLGKDPDDEKTWNDLESEFLMIDDSVRLNEAGVIKTRGAHHPLKLDPKEAILRPDMHAYAPFSTLLPHGAMQVGHQTTAEQESAVDDGGFVIDLFGIQVWQLGERPTKSSFWHTVGGHRTHTGSFVGLEGLQGGDVNPMKKVTSMDSPKLDIDSLNYAGGEAGSDGAAAEAGQKRRGSEEWSIAKAKSTAAMRLNAGSGVPISQGYGLGLPSPTSAEASSVPPAVPAEAQLDAAEERYKEEEFQSEIAAATPAADAESVAERWYYDDSEGHERHGPFTLEQMHEWVHDGHFTDEDIVYEGYDGPHITLGEAFATHKIAHPKYFMVESIGEDGETISVGPYRGADLLHWHGAGEIHPDSLIMEVAHEEPHAPMTGEWVALSSIV